MITARTKLSYKYINDVSFANAGVTVVVVGLPLSSPQGRSERGGGMGGGGASPPNNMSQSAKSANYTHTSIRIGKTKKLDKDYVL